MSKDSTRRTILWLIALLWILAAFALVMGFAQHKPPAESATAEPMRTTHPGDPTKDFAHPPPSVGKSGQSGG